VRIYSAEIKSWIFGEVRINEMPVRRSEVSDGKDGRNLYFGIHITIYQKNFSLCSEFAPLAFLFISKQISQGANSKH